MVARVYHGDLTTADIARALMAEFDHGNMHAQAIGSDDKITVQIASVDQPTSGGETALSVFIEKVDDGVAVQLGQQAWLGVAASLGKTAFTAWRNPFDLISRLDDIAQDIEYIQLPDKVWAVIENAAHLAGAAHELSDRLRRITCAYCETANPVGESNCIACGAPLGLAQPKTCPHCGFVITSIETKCPNCGQPV